LATPCSILDFEGSGNYTERVSIAGSRVMAMAPAATGAPAVEEPSFEPGETTLTMRMVGKVRFK
jgi:hypothetical protein